MNRRAQGLRKEGDPGKIGRVAGEFRRVAEDQVKVYPRGE